ncbi:FAD:protein FMN transferase [Paucihalobacter ruber]|uniref:FAD:protein FMN transferase n=1 Tax=Paucihalobacter ruber TaxID=2567861 RepID=A0A506PP60_9FLAO|nr:FAD:protein FMN transferase [Paucihalobacter ruber]TPV35696.1 FAD:protein FMN transferase [Paucihalobacter ruber]
MRLLALSVVFVVLAACSKPISQQKLSGPIFGTYYNIIYDGATAYNPEIDSIFDVINESMSTYIENSDISKINRNEAVAIDNHFQKVFEASKLFYKATDAAFDPTIGILVNAWSFGPTGEVENLDSLKIESLMQSVGFNKVTMNGNRIVKQHPETFLDFNAIAKGYAVDVIAAFLSDKGHNNFLVDIGGEISAKGFNMQSGNPWKIGIDDPNFDGSQSYSKVISLNDEAMATSGTYRKYKVDRDGNRYSHIIDTKTGYPSKTNLLSISVIAEDCMTADAYATAFKAMGIEKIKEFLNFRPDLKVYLIFENENNQLETLSLNNFPE